MLRMVLLSAMVLQATIAQAQAGGPSAKEKVEVTLPRLQFVRTEAELRRLCGVNERIDACTGFVAYRLSTSCASTEKGWSMTASARFTPYIVLRRRDAITHEMLHIRDVQRSLADFLVDLEQAAFTTQGLCEDAAARAASELPRLINEFARASNEKRHPGISTD